MIKISIIMPVYNKEKYLKNTIDSILKQEYKNFELIIVDDGSTDKSKYICDEYASKDSRIKVYHIKNEGVSNARNIGLKYATGDYIQFIDADDCINNEILKEYEAILEKEDYDIIFSAYNKVDYKNNILETLDIDSDGAVCKNDILMNFVENQVNTGYYGCVSNKLVKLCIINTNKIKFNKKITLAEDFDFFLDVYRYSEKLYFTKKISFNYLQEAENSSMLLYDSLDYYIQLLINLKMKNFVAQSGCYSGKNKYILDYRIIDYVYFVVFYTELSRANIKERVMKLYKNKEIMNSIDRKLTISFKRLVVNLITKNRYNLVYNCLYIRNIIRNIVRTVVPRGR